VAAPQTAIAGQQVKVLGEADHAVTSAASGRSARIAGR
jgi:hypothetical protein